MTDKANGREALELPIHPDPHAWTWTEAEKRVILAWGESLLSASQAQRTETAGDSSLIDRYTSALVAWRCDGGPFGPVEAAEKELRAALNRRTETAEPVAWRIRHRSEPGMVGHYPWSHTDRIRGMQLDHYEYEPLYANPPASTTPDISPENVASILDTYRKLHEGKIGAHWLWCVIEQIAAGVSEGEAMREYGYYSTAPVTAPIGYVDAEVIEEARKGYTHASIFPSRGEGDLL